MRIYAVAVPLALGIGVLSQLGALVGLLVFCVGVLAYLLLGAGLFLWLGNEEDWWDDFRAQNRALLAFAVLHLGALPAAWSLGVALAS